MGSIFDIINVPLGYLFRIIYLLVGNYGWTLVIFTIVTKLLLTPLTVKQQKSTQQMQKIQPRLQELQKKYQYDKEKLNQETMKLYKDNNINPASGCLPLLIQFPILIGLYNIIRSPLTYVLQLGKQGLPSLGEVHDALTALGSQVAANDQIKIAAEMSHYKPELLARFQNIRFIDFNFFGLNLAETPNSVLSFLGERPGYAIPIILIPILAGLTTFLVSKMTQTQTTTQPAADAPGGNTMQMMTYLFPFMTVFFSFSLPAGLGFYWILSNLYQMGQQSLLPKLIPMDTDAVADKQEHFRERKNRRKKK